MFRSTHPATIAKKKARARRKQQKRIFKQMRRHIRSISKILTTR